MKLSLTDKSLTVLNYLKEHQGENMTAEDIAVGLGKDKDQGKKEINGIVTSGLQKKGYAERIPAEIELEDGSHKPVKFIRATEAGLNYDHAAATAADIAAAQTTAE